MKPDERALEKQLKRIIRGESADSTLLANHWQCLGRAGDQIVIRALNRANGWDTFANYASQQPGIQELGQRIEDLREQAIKIVQGIETNSQQNLGDLIRNNPDLFDTVLTLLETSKSESAAEFVNSLVDRGFNKEQETRLRKLLYHFRQKGIRTEAEVVNSQSVRELFFFGENRLPLWQPLLYFRPHSVFASNGDLLILRIIEGSETAPAEQQRNVALNQSSMNQLAERYAAQLSRQLGIEIQFHSIDPSHARFLLQRSAELISESSGAQSLQDFLKFIGPEPAKNPFEVLNKSEASATADLFLREPYFSHWTLNPHDIEEYLSQLAAQEKGPIILTGSSLAAKKMEIRSSSFQKVFTTHERFIWSFAFQKAAFYLQKSNPDVSGAAMYWAEQLLNPEVQAENVEIAKVLFDRTVEIAMKQQKAKQEEERKTSLIMTPDEFRQKR